MRLLVTGSQSSKIGGATCRRLAELALLRGEHVKLAACQMTETDTIVILANELRELGDEVIVLTGDLDDPNIPKSLIKKIVDEFGGLDAVASMSGMGAHSGMGAYSPSKAALISLCQVLTQEWAADGINVNIVSPGMIHTPLTYEVYENNKIAKDRSALVPLGRVGGLTDIANIIGFLLSKEAEYMTGENLLIDVGFVDSLYSHIPDLPRSTN